MFNELLIVQAFNYASFLMESFNSGALINLRALSL